MGHCKSKQRSKNTAANCTLAQALAPEDIQPGDYVARLYVTCELPSFFWCADALTLPLREPVRMQFVPTSEGVPLKVKSVCLPYVLVKSPSGHARTVDVRRYRLARLDRAYARSAWKAHKSICRKKRESGSIS
jgi:hypothetical protein